MECVIGLAANLFYNSPMEACILVCRTNKRPERRGQILFINAVNEVERKNAQSYLEDAHIKKIADAYLHYKTDEGFAYVATLDEVKDNKYSLSIPLYVKQKVDDQNIDVRDLNQLYHDWKSASGRMHDNYKKLISLMQEGSEVSE